VKENFTSTRNLAQVGCVDDKHNFLNRLSVIILPHHRHFATQLTDRNAFLGALLLGRFTVVIVVNRVEVGSNSVHRMCREVHAARILNAVEKHRFSSISWTNAQERHDK
jgi:hypothetical protein